MHTYLLRVSGLFVDDEAEAKLLSRAAGARMRGVFVKKKSQLRELARHAEAGGFCEEVRTAVLQPALSRRIK